MPTIKPLAVETTTAGVDDATLAATAEVPVEAITAFRAGSAHWVLERPGVIRKIAAATGTDEGAILANFRLQKSISWGQRRHPGTGPASFGGSFPSIRS